MHIELTQYWHSETIQKDSDGLGKNIVKHYVYQPEMDFDKVLSLLNQDLTIEFTSLSWLDKDDKTRSYPQKNEGDCIVDDGFLDGLIVFSKNEKISVLRDYLNEISFKVSRFSFVTSDGVVCYNNQNRYDGLEFDIEIPLSLKVEFFKRVCEVDSVLGEILTEAEIYPDSFLFFRKDILVAIFPNIPNTDDSLFKDVQSLSLDIDFKYRL